MRGRWRRDMCWRVVWCKGQFVQYKIARLDERAAHSEPNLVWFDGDRTSGAYQTAQKQCDLFNGMIPTPLDTFNALNTQPHSNTTSSIQLFLPLYVLSTPLLLLPLYSPPLPPFRSSHLLSVHFHTHSTASLTSPYVPLHPSLALVIKEEDADAVEYILRETGQIVGVGEEGVVEMWREVLGCDTRGIAVD